MNTDMTPMKRLSNGMNQFRENVEKFFNEVTLNKSAPKYNPYAYRDDKDDYSKGVKNDFVMIFNAKDLQISFAINFNYKDNNDNILPIEEQKIDVNIKKSKNKESIVNCGSMTINEFKLKLNEINKLLRDESSKNINEVTILEKVSEVFFKESYDLRGEIEKEIKNIENVKKTKRKEYDIENLECQVVDKTKAYEQAEKKIRTTIEKSKEKAEVERLTKELCEARNKLKEKNSELQNKYKLTKLNEEKFKARNALKRANENMNKEIEMELMKLRKIVNKPKM